MMHEIIKRFHAEAAEYYETSEYQAKVARLEQILEPVRGRRIGWDLEGVLVNKSPFGSQYPFDVSWEAIEKLEGFEAQILWRFCRPLANDVLAILHRHNTLKVCSVAGSELVRRLIEDTDLNIPEGIEVLDRERIQGLNGRRGKCPEKLQIDLLIDDFECEDEERTLKCPSFGAVVGGVTAMRSFYNRTLIAALEKNPFDRREDYDRYSDRQSQIFDAFEGRGISIEIFKMLYKDDGMIEIAQVMSDFFAREAEKE